jgi:hypothetical protein
MANSLLTIDMVTREALRVAHESCAFISTTDLQYDNSFGQTGAKIGSTLRVRKPNQYVRTQGSRVMDVQDQAESNGTITVATQDHVDMRFNSAELTLSIDDFSKRYIEPAVKVLVSGIESDYLTFATQSTYNVAGSAGSAINSLAVPGGARTKINQGLAPKNNRSLQLDSGTNATLVAAFPAYFNPSNAISEQYREGMIARTSMADYYENERVYTHTVGSDVTVNTSSSAAVTDGGTNITMNGSDGNIKKGDVFTVAGVYACHPETKRAYPNLQQFVATADSTGAITVSPPTYLTGPKQNVASASSAQLATTDFNSKAMTFVGTANSSYVQPLMYHKEAFQFVTADLPLMAGAEKCVRRVQDGLSMRVWQDSDIRNDELLMRIDILYGFAALRPEWACRLVGSAVA